MKRKETPMWKGPGIWIATLSILAVLGVGCGEESPTGPAEGSAPTLPDSEWLDFNPGLFDGQGKMAGESSQNFFNAAARVAVIQFATRIVLAPPVAAVALAVHTIPSPQPDGSWLWVYTFVNGDEEAQIRLRGKRAGAGTEWEMRITNLFENPPIDKELWFDGETRNDGQTGDWTFYDFKKEGKPAVARIEWETDKELRFTDLWENPDDELAYLLNGNDRRMEWFDASEEEEWFIHWNEESSAGSIRWEDYRNGEESCWDEDLIDVDCESAKR